MPDGVAPARDLVTIVGNLIDNAFDAVPAAGRAPRAGRALRRRGSTTGTPCSTVSRHRPGAAAGRGSRRPSGAAGPPRTQGSAPAAAASAWRSSAQSVERLGGTIEVTGPPGRGSPSGCRCRVALTVTPGPRPAGPRRRGRAGRRGGAHGVRRAGRRLRGRRRRSAPAQAALQALAGAAGRPRPARHEPARPARPGRRAGHARGRAPRRRHRRDLGPRPRRSCARRCRSASCSTCSSRSSSPPCGTGCERYRDYRAQVTARRRSAARHEVDQVFAGAARPPARRPAQGHERGAARHGLAPAQRAPTAGCSATEVAASARRQPGSPRAATSSTSRDRAGVRRSRYAGQGRPEVEYRWSS